MNAPQKFLFDTCFEQDQQNAGPNSKAKPAPKHSDEDLARARQAGFAEGMDAGEQTARQAIEQAVANSLDTVSEQLGQLAQEQTRLAEQSTREAIDAAVGIVKKLFPHLARENGLSEIDSVLRECLERLREEPRIVVRVSDSLLDAVEERIKAIAARAGFEGRIVFLSQDGMKPGDVRIEWADGGAERDSEAIWREIDVLLGRVIGLTQAEPGGGDRSGRDGARAVSEDSDECTNTQDAVVSA